MAEEAVVHEEIIIIKRGGGDHDGHHGGAWKIAFADFMTAMMAFFLVMWLINSSSEQTKKAVASYFNPIKLMDKTSNPKGIRDPKYGKPAEVESDNDSTVIASPETTMETLSAELTKAEAEMFADPYAVLSEIAAGVGSGAKSGEETDGKPSSQSKNLGISGGEAFHDPFDPSSWSLDFGVKDDTSEKGKGNIGDFTEEGVPLAGSSDQLKKGTENEIEAALAQDKAAKEMAAIEKEKKEVAEKLAAMDAETAEKDKEAKVAKEDDEAKLKKLADEQAAKELAMELREALKDVVGNKDVSGLNVSVQSTGDGAIISLEDDPVHGMFRIGSARPRKNMIMVMAKIAEIISSKSGKITISGHTDGRKYKSLGYDNWRLSTARAHMAHYMLVQGGLEEARVERIDGYADSKLKIPDNKLAASNRRIEIFLKNP
ncbi:MAG: MotB family protein [Rhizobiaceae bacterium]